MEDQVYNKLLSSYESIESRIPFTPKVACVLGSGLDGFADELKIVEEIDYSEIRDFPVSTVPGHRGRLVFGYLGDVPVVAMRGRIHYYEGYSVGDVVQPIRLMHLMGARSLVLTNAAGGVLPDLQPGDFMLITDHIASLVPSPLIGKNIDSLGERFPDMTQVYDPEYQEIIRSTAKRCGIRLREGVFMQFAGPQYETPAEVRMAKLIGAGAVGMSTAVEAIAARHCGMRICGISFISNMAAGLAGSEAVLTHEEVMDQTALAAPEFKQLLRETVRAIGGLS